VITPPEGWQHLDSCTKQWIDFTPDPAKASDQRKLAQRHYYGSEQWRKLYNLRSWVESTFGILKNPSRQAIRRGHNRLTGLATLTLINALKIAVYNEEQLRIWHDKTRRGPEGHPLLTVDPPFEGLKFLTAEERARIDSGNAAQADGADRPKDSDAHSVTNSAPSFAA
jgi:hypothetical protein